MSSATAKVGLLAKEIPLDADKRREWIKYKLKILGTSLAELGRQHQTTRQNVSTALYRPNPKWEYIIASELGLSPAEIWPERYDAENGIPKKIESS